MASLNCLNVQVWCLSSPTTINEVKATRQQRVFVVHCFATHFEMDLLSSSSLWECILWILHGPMPLVFCLPSWESKFSLWLWLSERILWTRYWGHKFHTLIVAQNWQVNRYSIITVLATWMHRYLPLQQSLHILPQCLDWIYVP